MRLALTTFVVLVVGSWTAAALADPPGLITRPDDRAGIHGANAPASTSQAPAVRPDDRAGIRGVGAPEIGGAGLPVSDGSGFDWVDAGVGAGSTLALMFVAGAVFLVTARRRGSSPTPALHG